MTKRKRRAAQEPHIPVAPPAPPAKTPRPGSKLAAIVEKLGAPDGVTVAELHVLTGWQEHSIRGALAGALKKRFGLMILSEKRQRGRVYRAIQPAATLKEKKK
jgi:hypothetical protein